MVRRDADGYGSSSSSNSRSSSNSSMVVIALVMKAVVMVVVWDRWPLSQDMLIVVHYVLQVCTFHFDS